MLREKRIFCDQLTFIDFIESSGPGHSLMLVCDSARSLGLATQVVPLFGCVIHVVPKACAALGRSLILGCDSRGSQSLYGPGRSLILGCGSRGSQSLYGLGRSLILGCDSRGSKSCCSPGRFLILGCDSCGSQSLCSPRSFPYFGV